MIDARHHGATMIVPCIPATDLFSEAERELTAFLSAVKVISGPYQVTDAARQWLQVLDDVNLPNEPSEECFRKVTLTEVASL
jgi:hypothetical protein